MTTFGFELHGTIRADTYAEALEAVKELTAGEIRAGEVTEVSLELDGAEIPRETWHPAPFLKEEVVPAIR